MAGWINNNRHQFWLAVVFAVFLVTRFLAWRSAGSFWFDEAFSVHFASMPLGEMWRHLQFEHNPLAHIVALRAWMGIFSASEMSARGLSILAGIASLGVLYWLAKELYGKTVGVWAAALMTLSTFMLYHQTEARMYGLVTLFALLTLWSFWRWQQARFSSKTGQAAALWLALYTLTAAALVHTHMTAWTLVLAVWLYWLIEEVERHGKLALSLKANWVWLVCNLAVLISFLLWFVPVAVNKWQAGYIAQGWMLAQTGDGFWFSHLVHFFLAGQDALAFRSLAALVLSILLIRALFTWQQPFAWQTIKHFFSDWQWPIALSMDLQRPTRFLLVVLLVPLILAWALQVTVSKYVLVASLPIFILCAKGLSSLKLMAVKAFTLALLIIFALPVHLRLMTQPRHSWDKVADLIAEQTQRYPDALVLAHSFAWALPLSFYDDGRFQTVPFYPLDDSFSEDERLVRYNWQALVNHDNVQSLAGLLQDKQTLILVSSTPNAAHQDPVKLWLWWYGWRLREVSRFHGYGDPEILLLVK